MHKAVKLVIILLAALLMGCSSPNMANNLWKIPPEKVNKPTLTVTPSSNITIHSVGNMSTAVTVNSSVNSTANITRKKSNYIKPPSWPKYKLVYARVGWGYLYIHPFIICIKNNSTWWVLWLNKSVQTTQDVLKYIHHQKWVWINWSNDTVWLNGTYFRIIAWMKPKHNAVHTKYWKEFWERELKSLNSSKSRG